MKKSFFAIIAVMIAAVMLFSGCKIKEVPLNMIEPSTDGTTVTAVEIENEMPLAGGWTYASEFADVQIPEDAGEALTKAAGKVEGVIFKPVAYLGSQVVAGVNYAYICEVTTIKENPVSTLNVVRVYRDLEGGASVTGSKVINIAEYNGAPGEEAQEMPIAGGWSYDEASGGKLPENVKAAYAAAKKELEGSRYEPIACLGSQVVAGANYAVLCKDVSDEENISLYVIIIYAGVDGTNQISSLSMFRMPEFD